MSDSTATTEALHNEAEESTREALGYIGYCHLGKSRVWSSTFEGCKTEAVEFMRQAPKYMTRKGLFIYKLIMGEEKKFVYKLTKCNH
jgi:hypothetical protein